MTASSALLLETRSWYPDERSSNAIERICWYAAFEVTFGIVPLHRLVQHCCTKVQNIRARTRAARGEYGSEPSWSVAGLSRCGRLECAVHAPDRIFDRFACRPARFAAAQRRPVRGAARSTMDRAICCAGLSRCAVAGLSRMCWPKQFGPSICRLDVEAQFDFPLDDRSELVEPRVPAIVGVTIKCGSRIGELLVILHPLRGLRKLMHHLMQLADLLALRRLRILALDQLVLFGRLVEDVVGEIAQVQLAAVLGLQVEIVDDQVEAADRIGAQFLLHRVVVRERALQRRAAPHRHLVERLDRVEHLDVGPIALVGLGELVLHAVHVAAHAFRRAVPFLLCSLTHALRRLAVRRALGELPVLPGLLLAAPILRRATGANIGLPGFTRRKVTVLA